MSKLPWMERLNVIAINPDCATRDEIAKMAAELTDKIKKEETLLEMVFDLVTRFCNTKDGYLDSCAETTCAEPMRLLAEYGKITITHELGRRVIARVNK